MLGGVTIESEPEARAFTAAMRAHPAAWSPRDLDQEPFRPGDVVELEPCVGPAWQQAMQAPGPCPRVELLPGNELAARLVFAALSDHTRGLYPLYVEAELWELPPPDRVTTVLRVFRALQSPAVVAWLRTPRASEEG